ncbi:MAG: arylsulfatase [Candidatus Latescibacterota bacterium]|nr:arylsulfatase [Candidatus Latescibacterota bacterium]
MSRPNILLILTDDQGWGDLSCKGNGNIQTPHIDQLARAGADFDWFYVTPLCAPTRAEILTGRYYPRTGVRGVTRRAECLNLDETTLGDVCKRAGYRTGYFGKWHSGSAYPYHPNGRGFDEFKGFCCGHWGHYFDSALEHNGAEFKAEGYITDYFAEAAMDFIAAGGDEPFLCYLSFNVPHSPFQVPDEWFDQVRDREIQQRHRDAAAEDVETTKAVLAMCENLDWNVGRVLDQLEAVGAANDTIVLYLTDNGPNTWRWNGGMRGKKGSVDEGGVRTMFFLRWPERICAGLQIDQIGGAVDILPTLADLAGIECATEQPLDGMSLKPLLMEEGGDWPDRAIYSRSPNGQNHSVRTQRFRAGGYRDGLYEMARDIGQDDNLAEHFSAEHQRLMGDLDAWREEMDACVGAEARPLPVGYREFPLTYLNAQDGLPEGDITWSSIHPNASFFVGWKNIADGIGWEIEVQHAGEYEVSLIYACQPEDVGARVVVAAGDERLMGTIDAPFVSRLKDQDDRIARTESYEKEFAPLVLGAILLEQGRQVLRIGAEEKPGAEVMELRAIRLRRVD